MHVAAAGPDRSAAIVAQWTNVRKTMVRVAQPSYDDIDAASFGTRLWRVRFANGVPVVMLQSPKASPLPFPTYIDTSHLGYHGTQPTQVLRTTNGWFVAYNYGEFGGGLWLFDDSGRIARQLLPGPTHGLSKFGHDVLALQPDNPLYIKKTTVHRYAFRNDSWREVGVTQLAGNIMQLQEINRSVYGILVGWPYAWLIKTTLSGPASPLWRFTRDFTALSIARSGRGDFALGGAGYVVWLHRTSRGYRAEWYAPRDCAGYFRPTQDPSNYNARCIGVAGATGYRRYVRQPMTMVLAAAQNGELIQACCPEETLHFHAGKWTSIAPPPLGLTWLYDAGQTLAAVVDHTIWVWDQGHWSQLAASRGACDSPITSSGDKLWCLNKTSARVGIFETGLDDHGRTFEPTHGDAAALAAGLHGDVWFAEKDSRVVGHITAAGTLEELPLQAPAASISRDDNTIWLTTDHSYGYIDAADRIHNSLAAAPDDRIIGIHGGKTGAWILRTFGQNRVMADHAKIVNGKAVITSYVPDVNRFTIGADGSIWATTIWPVVIHMTEDGGTTQYRLPCVDPHIVLLRAPPNGVWFMSKDPHCSGYIDAKGIYPNRLPLLEGIEYK